MQKLTKIIATLGPSTDSLETIGKLIDAGVNVFRFNLKHNEIAWHKERVQRVREVSREKGIPVGVLIDLQGPEIRIRMPTEGIEVSEGMRIVLGSEAFSISHPEIIPYLEEGQIVIADDGAFEFILHQEASETVLVSKSVGFLKNKKTLNIPGANFPLPALAERDFEGLTLASDEQADYVALSFVRDAKDIILLRDEMQKMGCRAAVVAKVEAQKALEAIDEIIAETDGIMIARGDLAVEVAREQVPYWQKSIIRRCINKGVFVITATQMLLSMVERPYPTRAEVSDVANAIFDKTSTLMLSEETAMGKYPVRVIETMAKTAAYTESVNADDIRKSFTFSVTDEEELLCAAAYDVFVHATDMRMPIRGFIVFTQTGHTAKVLSRYRPRAPIFAVCPSKSVATGLSIEYGVVPIMEDQSHDAMSEVSGAHIEKTVQNLKKTHEIKTGDQYIVLHGDQWSVVGGTSTVKIITV